MSDTVLAQILQQLQASNASLTQALGAQADQLQMQREQSAAEIASLRDMVVTLSSRNTGVVDVRQVGKPDVLKGSKTQAQKDFPA